MRRQPIFAICLGIAVTLCVYGYRFERGNHAVYLLDAIRTNDPTLLQQDWFTRQTLQYHVIFNAAAAVLMKFGIEAPGFAAGYLLLVSVFHVAWNKIVKQAGGSDGAYLFSVVLYYLSAAGTGLGMYQFFQDSSFLPSNIANVAMLWGIYFWIARKYEWSGACFGLAGIFHLNHALVGIGMWIALFLWKLLRPLPAYRERRSKSAIAFGTLLAILPSAINIAFAAHQKLSRSGAMPLEQFVDLYVRLRHPHHYDPSSWPIGIWIAFLWTIPAALFLLRGEARRIVWIFLALIVVALIGAGFWFVSETLIQMSLYRFSIYVQLLGCAALAIWVETLLNRKRMLVGLSASACAAIALVCVVRGAFFGVFQMPQEDARYVALCHQVQQTTPIDAVFLVPPDEQVMRLIGRRAIVVNFRGVPQLSSELLQWQQRMCDVLGFDNLDNLPRGDFVQTLAAIRKRYDQLTLEQHRAIAAKYGARYVIYTDATGEYLLYDLAAR